MKGWVENHESSVVCVSAHAWRSEFHHSVFAAAGCSESQDPQKCYHVLKLHFGITLCF